MLLDRRSAPSGGGCVQSKPVTREPDPVVPTVDATGPGQRPSLPVRQSRRLGPRDGREGFVPIVAENFAQGGTKAICIDARVAAAAGSIQLLHHHRRSCRVLADRRSHTCFGTRSCDDAGVDSSDESTGAYVGLVVDTTRCSDPSLDVERQTKVADNRTGAQGIDTPTFAAKDQRGDLTATSTDQVPDGGPAKAREPRRSHAHD